MPTTKRRIGKKNSDGDELTYRPRKETGDNGVPAVRPEEDVVAVFCSDLHLSHTAPAARQAEPDWYAAMERGLNQLAQLQYKYGCPIVCAGDIFDRALSCPELVNFAIRHLPRMYAIPGQHDLEYHNYADIRKTSYWTLVEAGIIKDIASLGKGHGWAVGSLMLHPFPWGCEIKPVITKVSSLVLDVAVIHSYIWIGGHSYPDAPKDKRLKKYRKALRGYDAAVFGDNHKGFIFGKVCNCGTFFRRNSDEQDYHPMVGLLHRDGSIHPHYLKGRKDKFTQDEPDSIGSNPLMISPESLLNALSQLEVAERDFYQAAKQFGDKHSIARDVMMTVFRAIKAGKKP